MTEQKLKYKLALSLLQKLSREEKNNFVVSPLSLGIAFAALTAGLRGEARSELLHMFDAGDEDELHAMYTSLLSKKNLPLTIANKYLADEQFTVQPRFDSLLREKYESEVEIVDFAKDGREIEKNVNAWVSEKTKGLIPSLLPPNTIDCDTLLMLLNAIYFKGSWFEKFHAVSEDKNFKLRSGEDVPRKFIRKESEEFGYRKTDKLRLVRIPYREAGFFMIVAIPKNEEEHIDELISSMETEELVNAIKSPWTSRDVDLSMPKFKMEYTFKTVQNALVELGVRKIFVPNAADFGNLFVEVQTGSHVGSVAHKAVIEVDKEGTTAAAATELSDVNYCEGPPPEIVTLNRPFCFFIMSADDTVCFTGICSEPSC